MNSQSIFLISGFPNGFTHSFKQRLSLEAIPNRIVFIASDFHSEQTQSYAEQILQNFHECDITFEYVYIIDHHMSVAAALQVLKMPSLVWVMGGNTLLQMSYLNEYKLAPALRQHQGMIIGMSAGAINMAQSVVLAKDEGDDIPELSIYDGLGLVDINIEPHLDNSNIKHKQEILEAAALSDIYGLYDESFILVKENTMEIIGPYKLFTKESCKL